MKGDLPKMELVRQANIIKMENSGAFVYFKATCPYCGARVACEEADTIYDRYECYSCKKEFDFVEGGLLVLFQRVAS